MAETKAAEKGNHVFHQFHPGKTREYQPSSQRGCRKRNEIRIGCALLFLLGGGVTDLEVLEIWEEPDEIDDLPARTFGPLESKELESRREISKVPLDIWYEAGYLEMIYSKLLEICECGKVTQGGSSEPRRSEHDGVVRSHADTQSLDEWGKTKTVRLLERYRPQIPHILPASWPFVGREGVVKMGDGCGVPRVTCHGARKKGGCVVSKVGDNYMHEILRELGYWGGTWSGRLWGTSASPLFDFDLGSVKNLHHE